MSDPSLTELPPDDASWLDTYEDIALREAAKHQRPMRRWTDDEIQGVVDDLIAMQAERRRAIEEGRPWK